MWDTFQAWWLIGALVLSPIAIIGWVVWISVDDVGWTETLTNGVAIIGLCVVLVGLGLLGTRFLT